jgi:uncharacterized membrane protein
MILKKKKLLIITSLLTLLPIPIGLLLWNQFPETMAIHFGITGQADGYASPSFAVFVLPLILLAGHWICILATALDKSNKNRNQKLQTIVLWIIPLIGNLSCCGIYALALGWEFSPVAWTMIPMGLLFALIGNYMPKTRMNSTMGIKVPWTYSSEENWNATHRFAGKVWVIGGIIIALCGLLPHGWAVSIMLAGVLVLVILPIFYSWRYYKKELAEGKELKKPGSSMSKKAKLFSGIALALLTVFLCVVLFCGNIEYSFHDAYQDTYLLIDTDLYTDYTLYYDTIDHLEFREYNVPGLRVGGYGSFRLLMGFFENQEFGTYTRYTYYNPDACVVITAGDRRIVLSGRDYGETEKLYLDLLDVTAR